MEGLNYFSSETENHSRMSDKKLYTDWTEIMLLLKQNYKYELDVGIKSLKILIWKILTWKYEKCKKLFLQGKSLRLYDEA